MKTITNYKLLVIGVFTTFAGYSQMYISGDMYVGTDYKVTVTKNLNTTTTGMFTNIGKLSIGGNITNAGMLINDGELSIGGNITNDGGVDVTPDITTGELIINGTTAQKIDGSKAITVNNLQINTQSLELTNKFNILGNAKFIKGIVTYTGDNAQIVFESASKAEGASKASYVEGAVLKKGSGAFIFPIGAAGFYNYVSLPEGKDKSYTFKYEKQDSNPIAPHEKKDATIQTVDNKQYWTFNSNGTGAEDSYIITLKLDDETLSDELKSIEKNFLSIICWDPTLEKWVDLGGTYDATLSELVSKTKFPPTCTLFAIGSSTKKSEFTVYNALSPNNDGINDFLRIEGIDNYPNNSVKVLNRWGKEIYTKNGYDNNPETSFSGLNQKTKEVLPDGTYYYIVEYVDISGTNQSFTGYLYISR